MDSRLVGALAGVAVMIFAGCVAPTAPAGETVQYDNDSFRVFAPEAPEQVYPGFPVTFPITIEGPMAESSHIGAHFWADAPADPTADIGDSHGCAHTTTPTALAGQHDVTCTFTDAGNATLHGHARLMQGETQFDYWSTARHVVVHEPYVLSVAHPPTQARAGFPSQFVMTVEGPAGISTHLGGHFWSEEQADPTPAIGDAWGCVHPEGQSHLPGTFTVSCTFEDPGTYSTRGHVRMELDGRTYDFWTAPFDVVAE